MSGRPEKFLDPFSSPIAHFAFALRRFRDGAGRPTYRTMAGRTHYSVTSLSNAASGKHLPSWPCVEAYVRACGAGDDEVEHWHRRWSNTRQEVRRARAAAAKPPAGVASRRRTTEEKGNATTYISASLPVRDVHAVPRPGSLKEYRVMLARIRVDKGLSLRQIVERSQLMSLTGTEVPGGLTRSQLHEMLTGQAPLRQRHVHAYLLACEIPRGHAAIWLARLSQLRDQDWRARAAPSPRKGGTSHRSRAILPNMQRPTGKEPVKNPSGPSPTPLTVNGGLIQQVVSLGGSLRSISVRRWRRRPGPPPSAR